MLLLRSTLLCMCLCAIVYVCLCVSLSLLSMFLWHQCYLWLFVFLLPFFQKDPCVFVLVSICKHHEICNILLCVNVLLKPKCCKQMGYHGWNWMQICMDLNANFYEAKGRVMYTLRWLTFWKKKESTKVHSRVLNLWNFLVPWVQW
jgi:hypothetical protein